LTKWRRKTDYDAALYRASSRNHFFTEALPHSSHAINIISQKSRRRSGSLIGATEAIERFFHAHEYANKKPG
jgi:hypothetical protein